jgi:nucleoside-diphosphate-sugar epimerase
VNATGALKVINAAEEAGCEAILQVSSAEVYGSLDPIVAVTTHKISESSPVLPRSSYGASKAAIDALVQVRWREARTPVISLRQFNCVGEKETHPYVITEIISQLFHGEDGVVHLGNNTDRDFLYAGDAVRMAVELLEKGEFGQVYNLGSETSISIYKLAQLVADVVSSGRTTIKEDASRIRKWEIWHLRSDNSKIYGTIESRPKVSLRDAIGKTVQYYLDSGKRWCWEQQS